MKLNEAYEYLKNVYIDMVNDALNNTEEKTEENLIEDETLLDEDNENTKINGKV